MVAWLYSFFMWMICYLLSRNSYVLDGIRAKLHEAFDMKDLEMQDTFWACVLRMTKNEDYYGYPRKTLFAKCLSISIWWGGRY